MKSFTRVRLAVVVVSVLLSCSPAQDPNVKAATYAAQDWLAQVDSGRYGESWDNASALFQQKISRERWEDTMGGGRSAYGAVVSRQLKSATPDNNIPAAPGGKFVVIQFRTRFANSPTLIETITPMQEPNGQWRVAGYFVKPAE
jgi:Protein of unknown function (DUF4019)